MVELRDGLGSSDLYLICSLGAVRLIKKQWRYLLDAFCGMGIFYLTTETTAATLNSFLQHYHSDMVLGGTISSTLCNLQLEMGVKDCPLKYDYEIWEHLEKGRQAQH